MKVAVVVADRTVPAWQHACVRRLRALAGVEVSVAELGRPPRRSRIAEKLAGPAFVRTVLDAGSAVPADADVVLDLAGDAAVIEPPGGVWRLRFGEDDAQGGLPFTRAIAGGAGTVEIALVRHWAGREDELRRGRFPVTAWHPSTLRESLFEAAGWPAVYVAALRDGIAFQARTNARAPRPAGPLTPLGRARFAAHLIGRLAHYAGEELIDHSVWNVGLVAGEPRLLLAPGPLDVRWLPPPAPRTFIADPFFTARDGRRVLLVEQFDYLRDRGVIDALELDDNNDVVRRERLFASPTHLSYPYPFELDGELYVALENASAGEPALYRCANFPSCWERVPWAFPLTDALDTTIFPHGGRWWAFCTQASSGAQTVLHAYHAESPLGPWSAHALDPVVVDVSCARPAGQPFVVDGRLYRPGQDCSRSYGGGLVIARVDELTPLTYRETVVRRIEAVDVDPHANGIHTVSFCPGSIVLDAKWVSPDVRWLAWQLGRKVKRLRANVRARTKRGTAGA